MKINVKVYKNNKLIKRLIANRDKWRKLYSKLASSGADKWQIKVDYGVKEDSFGEKIMFSNSGTYNNLREAKLALNAFIEL